MATNTNEFLSNYIDEDFQSSLLPLQILETIFLHSMYRVKNNFIYNNSLLYYWNERLEYLRSHEDDIGKRDRGCHVYESMFVSYLDILRAYDYYKKIFQMPVIFMYFIEIEKTIQVVVSIWMLKNLMNIIVLVKSCEEFYKNILSIDQECTYRMSSEIPVGESKLYKNIVRTNKASFRKYILYGLFTLDATLPVGLVQTVTTYVIVLLQFALNDPK
ncbi:uncharacterized protein LOC123701953 [Colias croceus]|uniref:uncharacterized protein LOC123701953 n=1 Tax=Colias crocea TaxID=72248 RepID=UPI001E27B5A4|nr:uncharacterized protein LOC123701953 [Colias croceus]